MAKWKTAKGARACSNERQGEMEGAVVSCRATKCHTMGASIIRIGIWGPLYNKYDKEPAI